MLCFTFGEKKICSTIKKSQNTNIVVGMALKFRISVTKVLKLKVKKFRGLILTFVEVTGEKLVVEGTFCHPASPTPRRHPYPE